jgi:hypothetical protein
MRGDKGVWRKRYDGLRPNAKFRAVSLGTCPPTAAAVMLPMYADRTASRVAGGASFRACPGGVVRVLVQERDRLA